MIAGTPRADSRDMLLVVAALVLWLGFNFAVVFADLALVLREDRAARRAMAGPVAMPQQQLRTH